MVPPIQLAITPPTGVATPLITDSMSSSSKTNREITVRVFTAHIEEAGTYRIDAKASVFESQNPRLTFGHSSPYYWVMWPFIGMTVLAAVALGLSIWWSLPLGEAGDSATQLPDDIHSDRHPDVRTDIFRIPGSRRSGRPARTTQNHCCPA